MGIPFFKAILLTTFNTFQIIKKKYIHQNLGAKYGPKALMASALRSGLWMSKD